MRKKELLTKFAEVDLYPVTCEALSAGRSNLEVLDGILDGGAKIVQLRDKTLEMRDLFELAQIFREKTRSAGALLIINDHIDLALAVEADGVHLGQADFPLPAARRLAPELIIGRSSHNLAQALKAQADGADYVNIGPIFLTGTKPEHKVFLGPDAINSIGGQLDIPFTVMGGINETNIAEVVAAGARRVAVVTAVTQAADIAEAVRRLRSLIHHGTE
ncbi:MAG: thiamine phosphate synthase [Candidatus Lernaella stagnicola]|nr:thiamine phosphate synthase [Candidatus Lernaella stagnicola]